MCVSSPQAGRVLSSHAPYPQTQTARAAFTSACQTGAAWRATRAAASRLHPTNLHPSPALPCFVSRAPAPRPWSSESGSGASRLAVASVLLCASLSSFKLHLVGRYAGAKWGREWGLRHAPSRSPADAYGGVFVADYGNHLVWRLFSNGTALAVAGTPSTNAFSGDGGPATSATLNFPVGVAASGLAGAFYIAGVWFFAPLPADRTSLFSLPSPAQIRRTAWCAS